MVRRLLLLEELLSQLEVSQSLPDLVLRVRLLLVLLQVLLRSKVLLLVRLEAFLED